MKKLAILAAVICLFSVGALAQTVTIDGKTQTKIVSFAGDWELDVKKSKLSEMMRIESMTMKVTQTDKELKVETATKRASLPEGMGGRGGRGFGDGAVTYSLEGKETTLQQDGPNGPIPVMLKAKSEAGKMKLNSSRKFNAPNGGEVSVTTEETWELADEGKTLKVTRTTNSPRGAQTTEMYFTKK